MVWAHIGASLVVDDVALQVLWVRLKFVLVFHVVTVVVVIGFCELALIRCDLVVDCFGFVWSPVWILGSPMLSACCVVHFDETTLLVFCLCRHVRSRLLSHKSGIPFCVVPWLFSLLLFGIVDLWLLRQLGFCVDAVGFVLETFTTLDPPMPNEIAISTVASEFPFDFLGDSCLAGAVIGLCWFLALLSFWVVVHLVQGLHARCAGN